MLQRALGGGLGGLKNAVFCAQRHAFSTGAPMATFQMPEEAPTPYPGPKRWPARNRVVHAPVKEGEKPPLVEYFHVRPNIHHSTKKFWLVCQFVRGMSVDEAIKQLTFINKKSAQIAKDVIEEAREIALKEHNFEFRSQMFIGDCFAIKGLNLKGFRKHARQRYGHITYYHSHFAVRLVEGQAPQYYYDPPRNFEESIEWYVEKLRKRRINYSL